MRGWSVTVALCVLVSAGEAVEPVRGVRRVREAGVARGVGVARARRSLAPDTDRLLALIADYVRTGSAGGRNDAGGAYDTSGAWGGARGWFPSPIPIELRTQAESGHTSVLLVPVPVPVAAPPAPAQCPMTTSASGPEHTNSASNAPAYTTASIQNPDKKQEPAIYSEPAYTPRGAATPLPPPPSRDKPAPPRRPPPRRPATDERLVGNAPKFPPVENSQLLIQQFRAEAPPDPMRPPVVIDPVGVVSTDDYTVEELKDILASPKPALSDTDSAEQEQGQGEGRGGRGRRLKCRRRRFEASAAEGGARPPPPPRFERSLLVRARLTVPRADYTEPYSVWWDAASGAARVDFHGGSTSSYRMMDADGRVRSVRVSVDRTGETDVRRCWVMAPRRISMAERALPVLPALQGFSFAGYVRRGAGDGERAELWRHTLSGHAGELGAAPREALTFRHELLLTRALDNFTATPLFYSVRVDSSVLGADCDGYVHYFDDVQMRTHDRAMFQINIADACDQVETTNRIEEVEPLREFSLLQRDQRYDEELEQYKRKYDREYLDYLEEAVRKNVLIQSSRHVLSGNREGASFEMGVNFVSDRLGAERRVLLGVEPSPDADYGEPFPHSAEELQALRGRLPRKFDWRMRGAVTPVRNQWLCSSCWAFATVGAVEGALFVESGRLVALSEQALVDCADTYGANGCNGTWPSSAYNYVRDIGLPALDEYTPYQAKVGQCRADSVAPVARISGYVNVTRDNILALKVAIQQYGPTVVIIDAETKSFMQHKRGYYYDGSCRVNSRNHAVLAVGWTAHRGETYFILKNSWSAAWGEEGYVRIRATTNTCGVLAQPSVPRMRARDVLRVPAGSPVAL